MWRRLSTAAPSTRRTTATRRSSTTSRPCWYPPRRRLRFRFRFSWSHRSSFFSSAQQLSGSRGYSACVRNPGDHRFYHYTPSATYQLPSEESDLPSLKSILCSGDACVLFYAKREEQTHNSN